jgi:hypothetical protein
MPVLELSKSGITLNIRFHRSILIVGEIFK